MITNTPEQTETSIYDVIIKTDDPSAAAANPGTIRVFETIQGTQVLMRKQADGDWAVADGEGDIWKLTNLKEDATMKNMKKNDLIPNSDGLFDAGLNVLLIGLHGTGKTESIKQLAERRGLKMKYFSCSTLDPFTDLVGVPVPTDLLDADGNPTGEQFLKMIRPRDIDEADLIFFDELNRADAKTLNAIFEIIQFRSINGEPLKNLKACWGAINPPDEDYDVDRLDAALLDRFDLYINIEPKPSVSYMSQFMAPQYARALYKWWNEHKISKRQAGVDDKTDYISPRRLMKIGLVWQQFENMRLLKMTLPQGGDFDHTKLAKELKAASESIRKGDSVDPIMESEDEDIDLALDSSLGSKPYDGITYNRDWIRLNQSNVASFLRDHQGHYETHNAVKKVLENGIGGELLVQNYHQVLENLVPSVLEAMIVGFVAAKVSHMRAGMRNLNKDQPNVVKKLPKLYQALGGHHHLGFYI